MGTGTVGSSQRNRGGFFGKPPRGAARLARRMGPRAPSLPATPRISGVERRSTKMPSVKNALRNGVENDENSSATAVITTTSTNNSHTALTSAASTGASSSASTPASTADM